MRQVQSFAFAAVLAVTTSAWAGGGPYPVDADYDQASSRTRAQVIAELREAQRLGLMSRVEGDFPNVAVSGGTGNAFSAGDPRTARARIHAETVEAGRLGVLGFGEGNPPIATASQEELIAAAGRRAIDDILAAQHVVSTVGK